MASSDQKSRSRQQRALTYAPCFPPVRRSMVADRANRENPISSGNRPLGAIASPGIWRLNEPRTRARATFNRETEMFGKLNHLAITTDHYAVLGMFYRAVFGMK